MNFAFAFFCFRKGGKIFLNYDSRNRKQLPAFFNNSLGQAFYVSLAGSEKAPFLNVALFILFSVPGESHAQGDGKSPRDRSRHPVLLQHRQQEEAGHSLRPRGLRGSGRSGGQARRHRSPEDVRIRRHLLRGGFSGTCRAPAPRRVGRVPRRVVASVLVIPCCRSPRSPKECTANGIIYVINCVYCGTY